MSFSGKVLLVDDEAHIRKFIGLLLKQLGSPTVIEAGNGEDAVATYKQEKPDLVLLDINMPGLTGIETLRLLRQEDPECVVIMLTSLASRQVVEESLSLGASGYIRKDTPKEEITRMLGETIDRCYGGNEETTP